MLPAQHLKSFVILLVFLQSLHAASAESGYHATQAIVDIIRNRNTHNPLVAANYRQDRVDDKRRILLPDDPRALLGCLLHRILEPRRI